MQKTYIDIARELNVAVSTVSRAMNNKSGVSEKTRALVFETAKRLNYVPNETAINLVKKTSNTIAAVIPDIMNPYYAEIVQRLEATFRENNFSFILCITNESDKMMEYYLKDLLKKRVTGIILLSSYIKSKELLQQVRDNTVLVGISTSHDDIDQVECREQKGVYNAIKHLIEEGHRRIAFVGYKLRENKVLNMRLSGYVEALTENGIEIDEELIVESDALHMPDINDIKKLFDLKEPPTAIHCMNEYVVMGVYSTLTQQGYSIPEDISLSAQDGLHITSVVYPHLTTIVTPIDSMAKAAANLLMDRITNGREEDNQTILLNNKLKIGKSTGRIG